MIVRKDTNKTKKQIASNSAQKLLSLQKSMKTSDKTGGQNQPLKDALTKIKSKETKSALQKKLHSTIEELKK